MAIAGASEAGTAGDHDAQEIKPAYLAPSTNSESNRYRTSLIPIACWRVEDIRFKFDSSFVLPESREEFELLKTLIDKHTTTGPPPLSVFGHADPVGSDDYNKRLSGRRAAAIYGVLTRRAEVWDDLFNNGGQFTGVAQGDQWGQSAISSIRLALGRPDTASSDTGGRKQLFLDYMDYLCVDRSGKSFQVDPVKGFLGERASAVGKGDFQGCSEFNPVLIFSQQDETKYQDPAQKSNRDEANRPNRRVVTLLFRPGSKVDPSKWPCPSAKDGIAGCKKRFWSDGEDRRSQHLPARPRKYVETKDTFGCRFYDRLTRSSPCEHVHRPMNLRWISWVAKGMESEASLDLTGSDGQKLGTISATSYDVEGFDGKGQRFEFALDAGAGDIELAMMAGGEAFLPPALFQIARLLVSQNDAGEVAKSMQLDAFEDSREGRTES